MAETFRFRALIAPCHERLLLLCCPPAWRQEADQLCWKCEGCWCRQEELFDATRGFDEAANRLDRAGSPNEAFLGALPTISSGTSQHTDGMQVVVRGYRDIHNGQARLNYSTAAVMAEVKHPNILPLVGVCTDNGSAVYDLMEVCKLFSYYLAYEGRHTKLTTRTACTQVHDVSTSLVGAWSCIC